MPKMTGKCPRELHGVLKISVPGRRDYFAAGGKPLSFMLLW